MYAFITEWNSCRTCGDPCSPSPLVMSPDVDNVVFDCVSFVFLRGDGGVRVVICCPLLELVCCGDVVLVKLACAIAQSSSDIDPSETEAYAVHQNSSVGFDAWQIASLCTSSLVGTMFPQTCLTNRGHTSHATCANSEMNRIQVFASGSSIEHNCITRSISDVPVETLKATRSL